MDLTSALYDPKYAEICKRVSNNSQFWEDLYQEFRVDLLTNKHNPTDNVESYLYSVITRIWRRLTGYGHATKAESMRLANYADVSEPLKDYPEVSTKLNREELDVELNRLINSDNRKVKKQAEIFNACVNGATMAEIARETGINYRIVHDAVRETTTIIKSNMTKNDIKTRLLTEGVTASYSGKDKTFYTSKPLSKELEKKIIEAGFKTQKK